MNSQYLTIGNDVEIGSHLWQIKIPTKLPVGEHNIEVRATDMFGHTHSQTGKYRIE